MTPRCETHDWLAVELYANLKMEWFTRYECTRCDMCKIEPVLADPTPLPRRDES